MQLCLLVLRLSGAHCMAAPTKDIVVITHPAEHGVPRLDPEGGPVPPHTRLQLANRARPFRRWARLHYAYEQLPAAAQRTECLGQWCRGPSRAGARAPHFRSR